MRTVAPTSAHVTLASAALFEELGFGEIRNVLTPAHCAQLAGAVDVVVGAMPGSRNILDVPRFRELAATLQAHSDIAALLPLAAVAVQCTLFDKSAEINWLVGFHQDLSIPVQDKVVHAECSGWSTKEGVLYTQPPVRLLQSLVAVRVHLDDCGPESGPLRVVPRSHGHGRLSDDEMKSLRRQHGEVTCIARSGDVLVMRPLLLHSSPRAQKQSRRRVLHFVFGPPELPCGLRRHRAV